MSLGHGAQATTLGTQSQYSGDMSSQGDSRDSLSIGAFTNCFSGGPAKVQYMRCAYLHQSESFSDDVVVACRISRLGNCCAGNGVEKVRNSAER